MVFLQSKKFLDKPYKVLCGLDEVGRGPWAGPLTACALILKKDFRFKGLKDSKKLTPAKREKVYKILEEKAIFGIGRVDADELDKLGLIKATNTAFLRALDDLKKKNSYPAPDFLLVDGRDKLKLPIPHKTIIKGDEKIKIIACASIIAKVTRDREMEKLAKIFPEYGFDIHKGYGTQSHHRALKRHGACRIHRKSFGPVAALI